ncbi:MAG: hypothetical protein ABIJ39_12525 [Chloroflexota bacterium]
MRLSALAILPLLAACTGQALAPTPATVDLETEERAVYAALLADQYPAPGYVIMDSTATGLDGVADLDETLRIVNAQLSGVADETMEDFQGRNLTTQPLAADLPLGVAYTLFSLEDMRLLFAENQNGWDLFYNRYPASRGIITFSKVGFNLDFDQALVYVGIQSGWHSGSGAFYLLAKLEGIWHVVTQTLTWVS